ncbi:dephospho-CoA kinase [Lutibacter sp. A64]|uniref:dephospho-CoA kinase n=1 Tax=Lutibacter sp. A64 TaxID=2918526 RepID=UPI001F056A5E|nr:dephospho-CoA kinase [Lutibacter sp. A64]UMB54986.1 dephospho-CoA kinase [Lutibacter sp. A64]
MKIIGLTGGIGSGKTTVLELFKELRCATYVADIEAKKLMSSNAKLISNIKQLLGDEAYINGDLNRNYIAKIVFNNKEKLTALNALVHPAVREDFKNFVKKSKSEIIIYEAAILFESGSDTLCNYIITVVTDINERIDRIIKRDSVTKQQVLERMQHQLNDEDKIEKADFVINNSNFFNTKTQVNTIYKILLKLS